VGGASDLDFVDGWFASRQEHGTHDPALIALIGRHRQRESLAEPALLQALTQYAAALGTGAAGASGGDPSTAAQ
jgi:hypothetical protein